MAHSVTPIVYTIPSRWDASSSVSPNERPSASKASSICSVVRASANGKLSLCSNDSLTSSNDLSTLPGVGVKDMSPSLVQACQPTPRTVSRNAKDRPKRSHRPVRFLFFALRYEYTSSRSTCSSACVELFCADRDDEAE